MPRADDPAGPCHTASVSRRLRLALLLVAMAAAGPSATAAPSFGTARAQVAIAWFRANPASRPQRQRVDQPVRIAAAARVERIAQRDVVLPGTFRLHSLFQRPPPRS